MNTQGWDGVSVGCIPPLSFVMLLAKCRGKGSSPVPGLHWALWKTWSNSLGRASGDVLPVHSALHVFVPCKLSLTGKKKIIKSDLVG